MGVRIDDEENFYKTDMVPLANRLKFKWFLKLVSMLCLPILFPFNQNYSQTFLSRIVSERHTYVSICDDLIAYRLWKPLRMYKTLAILTMMKRIPKSYYNHGLDIYKVVTFTREMQFLKFIWRDSNK